ncbi:MAG: hypothetical protein HDS81_00565 [Bacteroidales bacterium]|nr:hypothetical protein [Bacteroidales bacterium]
MLYNVTEIMRDVRVAMDQNDIDAQLIAENDTDTLELNEIIESKIIQGVRLVHEAAPARLLEEGHSFGDELYWDGRESGHVLLPDDFMRLVAFRMSDWERTVYSAITPADPRYARQSSRLKGIRGNPQKPVAVIVNRAEGKALEFYSCKSEDAQVATATYLPYPIIDSDGGIDISERCYEAVIYTIAGLVAATYGDAQKAAAMNETAKGLIHD